VINNLSPEHREALADWSHDVEQDRGAAVAALVAESGLDLAAVTSCLIGLAVADHATALAAVRAEGFKRVVAAELSPEDVAAAVERAEARAKYWRKMREPAPVATAEAVPAEAVPVPATVAS
jgi:hypothetical protein